LEKPSDFELHQIQAHDLCDLLNPLHRFVHEHANRPEAGRFAPNDGAGVLGRDVARATGPENEPDSRRTVIGRLVRILQPGDAAHLHEQVASLHARAPFKISPRAWPGSSADINRSPIRNAWYPPP